MSEPDFVPYVRDYHRWGRTEPVVPGSICAEWQCETVHPHMPHPIYVDNYQGDQ